MPILIGLKASIWKTLLRPTVKLKGTKKLLLFISFLVNFFVCSLPYFPKGHSRHGTCMIHLKRYAEALKSFCKAHTCASSDKERNATASEVISAAMDIEGW